MAFSTTNKYGKTEWVNESRGDKIPEVGTMCWSCNNATLERHSFTSKKTGETYQGVICPACRDSWMISKFEKKQTQPAGENPSVLIMDELRAINERLDKLAEFLKNELGH